MLEAGPREIKKRACSSQAATYIYIITYFITRRDEGYNLHSFAFYGQIIFYERFNGAYEFISWPFMYKTSTSGYFILYLYTVYGRLTLCVDWPILLPLPELFLCSFLLF